MTSFQGTHTHALTLEAFSYEGEFEDAGAGVLRWRARVSRDGSQVTLTGDVRPQPPAGAPLQAVLAALHRRIDAIG
ncbi:hypothetical protein [Rubrivivax gelatinosus]|uniref:hypothetical protein n=1 Tax=Rubrivivax gelatinosus TaxID=28068 RepID=UPI00190416BC|nr:hypothetical protein [Rubrivivax gelatinosus]